MSLSSDLFSSVSFQRSWAIGSSDPPGISAWRFTSTVTPPMPTSGETCAIITSTPPPLDGFYTTYPSAAMGIRSMA